MDNNSTTWLRELVFELPYCCANPPVTLSQDGRYLAFASDKLTYFDTSTGMVLWEFDFPGDGERIKQSALGLAVSSNGSRIAAVTMNFEGSPAKLWVFTREGHLSWSADLPESYPWSVRTSADGDTLVVALAKEIMVFEASSPVPLMSWNSGDWTLSENADLSDDGRSFAVLSTWMPGRENARLFFLNRDAGLLWARDTGLSAIEASLDMSKDGRTVVAVDRRSGSLAAFDSFGNEVFGRQFKAPASNGLLLNDGKTLLIAPGGDVLLLDTRSGLEEAVWQSGGEVWLIVLSDPYFALVYSGPGEGDSLVLGRLG